MFQSEEPGLSDRITYEKETLQKTNPNVSENTGEILQMFPHDKETPKDSDVLYCFPVPQWSILSLSWFFIVARADIPPGMNWHAVLVLLHCQCR